jgi:Rrf2 family protein
MKLSRKCEYACLAMIELSKNKTDNFVKIEAISQSWNIPRKFLEQILIVLKNAGYVYSRKGADGGYKLAKESSKITLAEIIRLIDGALAPVESVSKYFYETSPVEKHPGFINIMKDIRDYIANKLEKTTFNDIVKK